MDKNSKGFTLIELIITLSIILLFVSLTIPRYNTYTQQLRLKNDAQRISDIIELAKKKAITSDLYDKNCAQFNGYRITVDANSYIMKFGCSGAYQNIETYSFDSNITAISGTGDFNFPALGLNTNLAINSIRLKNSSLSQCVDITISKIGIIEINGALIDC